jgi:hypothetical protein
MNSIDSNGIHCRVLPAPINAGRPLGRETNGRSTSTTNEVTVHAVLGRSDWFWVNPRAIAPKVIVRIGRV